MRAVPLPPESSLAPLFAGADLADAFAVAVSPAAAARPIEDLARVLLGNPSWWFRLLLAVRDGAVAPFGVKTSHELRVAAGRGAGGHVDFFPVMSRTDHELILGEDDRHLDFRASILMRDRANGSGRELVLTTIVHCHNTLGRSYLLVIRPFHYLVVTSSLRRAARRGWRGGRG